jgi:hypothetical protein
VAACPNTGTEASLERSRSRLASRGSTAIDGELDLSGRLVDGAITSTILKPTGLLAVAELLPVVRRIHLHNNSLETADIQLLAEAVVGATSLSEIQLDGCLLPVDLLRGAKRDELSGRFEENVNLSYKNLGDASAVVIAAVVRRNRVAVRLDVSNCSIGPAGVIALTQMLLQNNTLRELSVRGNAVDDESIDKLLEALTRNSRLSRLDCGMMSGMRSHHESRLREAYERIQRRQRHLQLIL